MITRLVQLSIYSTKALCHKYSVTYIIMKYR